MSNHTSKQHTYHINLIPPKKILCSKLPVQIETGCITVDDSIKNSDIIPVDISCITVDNTVTTEQLDTLKYHD